MPVEENYRASLAKHSLLHQKDLKAAFNEMEQVYIDDVVAETESLAIGEEDRKKAIEKIVKRAPGIAGVMLFAFPALYITLGVLVARSLNTEYVFLNVVIAIAMGELTVCVYMYLTKRELNSLRQKQRFLAVNREVLGRAAIRFERASQYVGGREGSLKKAVDASLDELALSIVTMERALPEDYEWPTDELIDARGKFRDGAKFFENLCVIDGKVQPYISRAETQWRALASQSLVGIDYCI